MSQVGGIAVQTTKQISVYLENKPGRLAQVLSYLAREKINITAMAVMDSSEHSVLRLVTEAPAKTSQALQALNIPNRQADVLVVELKNQPGALAHICETLGNEHISIDYCYVSSGGRNGRVFGIFKVSNPDKAIRALGSGNNVQRRRIEPRPVRDQRTYRRG
jgi:hypothetical protein